MTVKTHYWQEVQDIYAISDYPDVDGNIIPFPTYVGVAYAVGSRECGGRDWIVDGGPQICEHCGNSMFRIVAHWYKLEEPG